MERGRIAFYVFLAACSVLLLQSCAKKDNEKDPNAPCDKVRLTEYECKGDCGNPLCGRWRWVETSAPLPEPHNLQTPESTGRCQVLCLSHDSTWRYFLDGTLQDTGRYVVTHKVAKKVWGKTDESYDEIHFLSQKTTPHDLSQRGKEGIGIIGGSRFAYQITGNDLYLGDQPGAVGGASYTWKKR